MDVLPIFPVFQTRVPAISLTALLPLGPSRKSRRTSVPTSLAPSDLRPSLLCGVYLGQGVGSVSTGARGLPAASG